VTTGFWIDDKNFYYSNTNKIYNLMSLSATNDGFHNLVVYWQNPITVYVDGVKIESSEPNIFECSAKAPEISFGIWVPSGGTISADFDLISISEGN
jgi:hypothetical protein